MARSLARSLTAFGKRNKARAVAAAVVTAVRPLAFAHRHETHNKHNKINKHNKTIKMKKKLHKTKKAFSFSVMSVTDKSR